MPLEESIDYASFLVRLWRSREAEATEDGAGWQGEVQHIQSSQRWAFDTLDELLRVLGQQAGAAEEGIAKDKYKGDVTK
jgi:hypothetical protein